MLIPATVVTVMVRVHTHRPVPTCTCDATVAPLAKRRAQALANIRSPVQATELALKTPNAAVTPDGRVKPVRVRLCTRVRATAHVAIPPNVYVETQQNRTVILMALPVSGALHTGLAPIVTYIVMPRPSICPTTTLNVPISGAMATAHVP